MGLRLLEEDRGLRMLSEVFVESLAFLLPEGVKSLDAPFVIRAHLPEGFELMVLVDSGSRGEGDVGGVDLGEELVVHGEVEA